MRESVVWTYFTKKTDFVATCNLCHRDYSYKTSISNLQKHYKNIHGKFINQSETDCDSDGEQEKKDSKKKSMATWNYFEVLDSEKFEATCRICDKIVSYDSTTDLRKHIEEHGETPKDSDDEYTPDFFQKNHENNCRGSKRYSPIWKYFKIVDDKMATCLICNENYNYACSISNLRKHLKRWHPDVIHTLADDSKKMIISANGQIYEIETDQDLEGNDDEKEPLEMDTIYLDDLDQSEDLTIPSPKKKKPKLTPKKDFTEYPKIEYKEHFKRNFSKEQVKRRDTCSVEPEQVARTSSTNTMGPIDYFGQYIVSLLKELPKSVSDHLQSQIVSQILASKMNLQTQNMAPKYEITVSNVVTAGEVNVPEPVSFTVVQSSTEKTGERTENVVQEQNKVE